MCRSLVLCIVLTNLQTKVTSVRRAQDSPRESPSEEESEEPEDRDTQKPSKWIINDGAEGEFDALIVTVGTCGKPKLVP